MSVNLRHPLLVALFLSLAASGCLTNVSPTPSGGPEESVRDEPAPLPAPPEAVLGPVAGGGPDVLGPRVDSERVGEETAFIALYGPGFSQKLSPSESGGITLPRDGRVDVALRMQRFQSTLGTGLEAVNVEPGLQVRLIVTFRDSYGKLRYRHSDALTSAVKPEGFNVSFTDVDVSSGGQIEVFVVNPVPSGRAPTADFSTACVNFPDETNGNAAFIGDLILARDFLFVGTFQLMITLDLGPTL